jgi:hypothetical protein
MAYVIDIVFGFNLILGIGLKKFNSFNNDCNNPPPLLSMLANTNGLDF